MIWLQCIVDQFRDPTLSGRGKAGWAVVPILLPWSGGLIYLIASARALLDSCALEQSEYVVLKAKAFACATRPEAADQGRSGLSLPAESSAMGRAELAGCVPSRSPRLGFLRPRLRDSDDCPSALLSPGPGPGRPEAIAHTVARPGDKVGSSMCHWHRKGESDGHRDRRPQIACPHR